MTDWAYRRNLSFVPKKLITLKQARQSKGLTQTELEGLSGINQRNISKIERGSEPMFTTGLKLADALGVDPHVLRFGQPESIAS